MRTKNNKPIALVSFLTVALTLATSSFANPPDGQAKQELAPIIWPQTPRAGLKASEHYTTFDGIQVPMLYLQAGKLSIELTKRNSLAISIGDAARYSGEITDSQLPGISIGLSIFNSKEFLPDLSEASWLAYKTGLTSNRADLKIVFENSNIESPAVPYVFGKQFRQLAYEQETARGVIKRREIFSFVGDTLLVFTINGSKQSVDQNWGPVENLISEMSLN